MEAKEETAPPKQQPPPLPPPLALVERSVAFVACIARRGKLYAVGLSALTSRGPPAAGGQAPALPAEAWTESEPLCVLVRDPGSAEPSTLAGEIGAARAAALSDGERLAPAEAARAVARWVEALPGGATASVLTATLGDASRLYRAFEEAGLADWLVARWGPRLCRAGLLTHAAEGKEEAWLLQLIEDSGGDATSLGYAVEHARAMHKPWLRSIAPPPPARPAP